jgi:hypothetical protein
MSQLQAAGILRSGRQWVAIVDLDRLESWRLHETNTCCILIQESVY